MIATMLVGCGSSAADTTAPADSSTEESTDASADASADAEAPAASGDLIKVGIINNDPNESGYRTANDKDMKAMFTEENGYEASIKVPNINGLDNKELEYKLNKEFETQGKQMYSQYLEEIKLVIIH